MTDTPAFVRLDTARHDRVGFDCGRAPLNDFLARRAAQNAAAGASRTWVLPDADGTPVEPKGLAPLIAFFTLSLAGIDRGELPEALAKRLPRYPVPVYVIGQLAVARAFHGRGFGAIALGVALRRLVPLHEVIGGFAVVVDCLDDDAERFYAHQGFAPLGTPGTGERQRMFLPMKTLLAAL